MSNEQTQGRSGSSAGRWLTAWHWIFGTIGVVLAYDYIRRGLESGSCGELAKGIVWALIALAMILPDVVAWLRRRRAG